ncbi:hypothetical protein D9M71_655520 [compost metagenome]
MGDVRFTEDSAAAKSRGVDGERFAEIEFSFELQKAPKAELEAIRDRVRAEA